MRNNKSLWWEKTVEYAYVKRFLGDYSFLYPFDGEHEKLSDALLSNGFSWIIIEFKQDQNWIRAEIKKFNKYGGMSNYSNACENLVGIYGSKEYSGIGHHFIVYGKLDDHDNLDLFTERYFSTPNEAIFKPIDLLLKGIKQSDFIEYVNLFNLYKNYRDGNNGQNRRSKKPKGPGPRSLNFEDYASVIGIGVKDNVVVCVPMKKLVELITQEKKQENANNNSDVCSLSTSKQKHQSEEITAEEITD
ncbi:TPA: hypothetical protein ACS70C_001103 [Providencia alcalifaciens]